MIPNLEVLLFKKNVNYKHKKPKIYGKYVYLMNTKYQLRFLLTFLLLQVWQCAKFYEADSYLKERNNKFKKCH